MFDVWAPRASRVEVVIAGAQAPLERREGGWWHSPREIADGSDYAFRLDGGAPLPDPRSAWQPHGVHGPSRVVDHDAFDWTDQDFQARPLSSAVIYELHVGTFTSEGTFEAVISRLPHLKQLGVTHVELMPVADFPGDFGWGYDGVSLFAPRHVYGGPQGLKTLVNACHQQGLGILLDVVYNHLGPSGNYLAQFGPYFTDAHQTPWGAAINFDGADSDEVRRFFCDNALMWLRDYHFDGLRLDAIHAILDTSAISFLEELATDVDALRAHLGRHLFLIAESDLNDPRVVRPWEMGGLGLDGQWCDDFHHAVHAVVTGEIDGYYADFGSMQDVATAFTQPYVYAGRHSTFRRRRHGRPSLGMSASRFVTYSQNHDQLGNRASGERICHLVNLDRAKLAAALVFTSPYVPLLFQGEEWAATAPFQYFADWTSEPELGGNVAAGRQREFRHFDWTADQIPDPLARATFERSQLSWDELDRPPHREMHDWYRQLVKLRREVSAFTDGRLDMVATGSHDEQQWLVVMRETVSAVFNFASVPREIALPDSGRNTILLASKESPRLETGRIELPPESVAIVAH